MGSPGEFVMGIAEIVDKKLSQNAEVEDFIQILLPPLLNASLSFLALVSDFRSDRKRFYFHFSFSSGRKL